MRVAETDTEERARDIAAAFDDYETNIYELMGHGDYMETYGYVAFTIEEVV